MIATHKLLIAISAVCMLASLIHTGGWCSGDEGYLEKPPIFIDNEIDVPLTVMATEMPRPGQVIPYVDLDAIKSDEFRRNGMNVQPGLIVDLSDIRVSALRGFNDGWAAGISVPYVVNRIKGSIGGIPAARKAKAFGDIALLGKKVLWTRGEGVLVGTAGIELPSGDDDDTFPQDNAVTNGYYRTFPRRIPLSWQPGSGTVDGLLAVAYGSGGRRVSYALLLGAKLHGRGDEDVKIGDIFVVAANGTYGINRRLALGLGLTWRSQADDDYPDAPLPGVNQPALAGTTNHGSGLMIYPSLRYDVRDVLTVGVEFRFPVVKPDDGMVPRTSISITFYPAL